MEKFIKCTNGNRLRNVPEKLFNSEAFKRTEWVRVEEVQPPPVVKQTKSKKVEVIEYASGLLEEFESLPDTNETFQNL
jgi:hypothetical protein